MLDGHSFVSSAAMKGEADILTHFSQINSAVVVPIKYYSSKEGKREQGLFITSYCYQARALSNLKGKFGYYKPDPKYDFYELSEAQVSTIELV